jgi:hypothetical protein
MTLTELIQRQELFSLLDCHLAYIDKTNTIIAHPEHERDGHSHRPCPYSAWLGVRDKSLIPPGLIWLITREGNTFRLVHMPALSKVDA